MLARNERGIAMALALYALVITGALVSGLLFAGTQEQRQGESLRGVLLAFNRAEQGTHAEIRVWDPPVYNTIGTYPQDSLQVVESASRGTIYKVNSNVYMVSVIGTDSQGVGSQRRGGGAVQRVSLLARLVTLELNTRASLTTRGNIKLSGNAAVDGNDHTPNASWDQCAAPGPALAGVLVPPSSNVNTNGNAEVLGTPPIQRDSTINASTFTQFGSRTYDQLAASAGIQFAGNQSLSTAPVVTGGVCNRTIPTNWGDGMNRLSPCGSYFPIIHVAGNVTLNGTQGQGILLVDGDLSVQGSYEWFGVVIAKGAVKTAGGGTGQGHFWGAIMAENVDLDINSVTGNAVLNYSACAIAAVLQATSSAAPMRSRGFTGL
jgi:hypothetical protein